MINDDRLIWKATGGTEVKQATSRVWRLVVRRLAIPVVRYHWAAAEDARRREDWLTMVRHIQAVHRWHWQSDESLFLLGSGYSKLERYEEAVDQLRRIEKPLVKGACEQERWLNLAVSLYHLGRSSEALEILPASRVEEMFPDYADAAAELRAYIEGEVRSPQEGG